MPPERASGESSSKRIGPLHVVEDVDREHVITRDADGGRQLPYGGEQAPRDDADPLAEGLEGGYELRRMGECSLDVALPYAREVRPGRLEELEAKTVDLLQVDLAVHRTVGQLLDPGCAISGKVLDPLDGREGRVAVEHDRRVRRRRRAPGVAVGGQRVMDWTFSIGVSARMRSTISGGGAS